MKGFSYPNVRNLFIPDPGFEFFDIDLDSADLRVVTYESDCRWTKQCFAAGLKPYVELAKEYYRDPTITKHHHSYRSLKELCHGSNYLGTPAGIAARIGLLVHEVDRVQRWYFSACPEIPAWQKRVIAGIDSKRVVANAWGNRLHIFDRIDDSVYRSCIAWIPASTVAVLINHGYVEIDKNLKDVQVLLQVHDSLAGQFPIAKQYLKEEIIKACTIPVPYADPLVIPVGIKCSRESWGACK